MYDLIPGREAVSLLARPSRGRKVHLSSLHKWGAKEGQPSKSTFTLYWQNGWKVSRSEFLNWARRVGKLYTPHVPSFREQLRINRLRHLQAETDLRIRLGN